MQILVTILTAYLFGCARLIQGGSKTILAKYFKLKPGNVDPTLPYARAASIILACIVFAALDITKHLSFLMVPIFAVGWAVTFFPRQQAYADIGHSPTPAIAGFTLIDKVLLKFWRNPVAQPGTFYVASREFTGMVLRQAFSVVLFTALALFINPSPTVLISALAATLLFAVSSASAYTLYNWVWPTSWSAKLSVPNPAELLSGVIMGILINLLINGNL